MDGTEKMPDFGYIDRNLAVIRSNMERAASRSLYRQEPQLLLAAKYATAEEMNYAASRGVTMFGENRVQSLLEKYGKLDLGNMELHFIGSLQKNKVKYIVGKVTLIHSLDSLPLAEEIERRSAALGIRTGVLIEVNSGEEDSKGGVSPRDAGAFADAVLAFPHLALRGIMTMAPRLTDKEAYRKYFRETYHLFIDIRDKKLHNIDSCEKPVLSMGMSDSYETAIEEGADIVRVGRAAFEK